MIASVPRLLSSRSIYYPMNISASVRYMLRSDKSRIKVDRGFLIVKKRMDRVGKAYSYSVLCSTKVRQLEQLDGRKRS